MPIRIVDTRSVAASAESRIFIGSNALRMLEAELESYCQRNVAGRSFLIAGHRGAGKTTLVDAAIQRVTDTFLAQRARQNIGSSSAPFATLRPLLVPLQGPNLLPPDAQDTAAKPTATGAETPQPKLDAGSAEAIAAAINAATKAAAGANPTPAAKPAAAATEAAASPPATSQLGGTETVLVQIILSLYRALANEFVAAYTETVSRRGFISPFTSSSMRSGPRVTSIPELELAAQFELDLDEYPGKARLRDYWRRIDALESGILFPATYNRTLPGRPPGNGYRELVALASACEAYQRICGHFTRKQETSSDDTRESRAALEFEAKGNILLKPLAILLTGAAAGAGASAAGADHGFAIFAGSIAALASAIGVKYSSSRTRRQAGNRSELFIPDLSVATLDRVLPLLIERIQRAGLAPIFLVDELDKVDLSERITDMVKRLKKLVAERAFFCFLTDRKYFEELTGRTADAPYPIEYTYYSHQLFIVYSHQDLHLYLNQVLRPTETTAADTSASTMAGSVAAAVAASPSAPPAPPNSAPQPNDDTIDAQILPYLILHAAQMHTIDIRRQLLALRNANGEVYYRPGQVRGHARFRYALLLQLCIETAFESPDMISELELRPAFLQIARDALYFISRRWSRCPDILDLSDGEARAAFETYLRERMETGANLTGEKTPDKPGAAPSPPVPAADFLFDQVRALAEALTSIDTVRKAAADRNIAPVILENLPKDPLLYVVGPNTYRWHCHPSGRAADEKLPDSTPAAGVDLLAPEMWNAEVDIIEEFEMGLSRLLRNVTPAALSNQLGILPTTPAWAPTAEACKRLRASETARSTYPDMSADIACVQEYVTNLRQNAKALSQLITFTGWLTPPNLFKENLTPLTIVAELLRLRHITAKACRTRLNQLIHTLPADATEVQIDRLVSDLPGRDAISKWLAETVSIANHPNLAFAPTPAEAEKLTDEAWGYWLSRLTISTIAVPAPGLPAFFCALQMKGPGQYLHADPDDLRIADWSSIFLSGLSVASMRPEEALRPWLTVVAAKRLGLEPSLRASQALMERGRLTPDDFSYGESSPEPPRTAALVIPLLGARTHQWPPQPAFPTLHFVPYGTPRWEELLSDLKQLNISIFALDGEVTTPSASPASPDPTARSPFAGYPHIAQSIRILGFLPDDIIPVIVDNPDTPRNWPPNFRATNPRSPEELFRAVQSLRESSTPRA